MFVCTTHSYKIPSTVHYAARKKKKNANFNFLPRGWRWDDYVLLWGNCTFDVWKQPLFWATRKMMKWLMRPIFRATAQSVLSKHYFMPTYIYWYKIYIFALYTWSLTYSLHVCFVSECAHAFVLWTWNYNFHDSC